MKNILLYENLTERLTLTQISCDEMLLVSHESDSRNFVFIPIDNTGIQSPIVQSIGSFHGQALDIGSSSVAGSLKFDSNNTLLGVAMGNRFLDENKQTISIGGIELLEFNKSNINLSNPIFIPVASAYDFEFSPDGKKLYTASATEIFQYDISVLDEDQIINSRVKLIDRQFDQGFFQIEKGPDEKLYFTNENNDLRYVGVIHSPNSIGLSCDIEPFSYLIPPDVFGSAIMPSTLKSWNSLNLNETSTPLNALLCDNSEVTIQSNIVGDTYLWQNGSTSPSLTITSPGTYWVNITQGSCRYSDTIILNPSIDTLDLGPNIFTCNSSSITIDSEIVSDNYLWSTGETSSTIEVSNSGAIWLEVVTQEGCVLKDTIMLEFMSPQQFSLGDDITICDGESVTLETQTIGISYLWSTGETINTIEVNQSGEFTLEIETPEGCILRDTINVAIDNTSLNLGDDLELCLNDSIILSTAIDGNYFWSDGSVNNSIVVKDTGQYWLEIETDNCTISDTIHISSKTCDEEIEMPIDSTETQTPVVAVPSDNCNVYLPNAITSNSKADNSNNLLRLFSNCDIESQILNLYDKWGNLLYSGDARNFDINRLDINSGIYAVRFTYRVAGDNDEKELLETVAIFR